MLRCPRPRPRGFLPPRSIRPRCARAPLGEKTRSAQRNITFETSKNLKKAGFCAKAPSHEKHFASLDVRGLWHARPLPSILPFTSNGLRPRTITLLSFYNNFLWGSGNLLSKIHLDNYIFTLIFLQVFYYGKLFYREGLRS